MSGTGAPDRWRDRRRHRRHAEPEQAQVIVIANEIYKNRMWRLLNPSASCLCWAPLSVSRLRWAFLSASGLRCARS